jgi:hypothetical protein
LADFEYQSANMEKEKMTYPGFIESPCDLGRIACCLNAIIEVFELSTEKVCDCSLSLIGNTVKEITQKAFSPFASPDFIGFLIQGIIDEQCEDEATFEKVVALSEQKYLHYAEMSELI